MNTPESLPVVLAVVVADAVGQAANVQEGPVRPTKVPPGHILASWGHIPDDEFDVPLKTPSFETVCPLSLVAPDPLESLPDKGGT